MSVISAHSGDSIASQGVRVLLGDDCEATLPCEPFATKSATARQVLNNHPPRMKRFLLGVFRRRNHVVLPTIDLTEVIPEAFDLYEQYLESGTLETPDTTGEHTKFELLVDSVIIGIRLGDNMYTDRAASQLEILANHMLKAEPFDDTVKGSFAKMCDLIAAPQSSAVQLTSKLLIDVGMAEREDRALKERQTAEEEARRADDALSDLQGKADMWYRDFRRFSAMYNRQLSITKEEASQRGQLHDRQTDLEERIKFLEQENDNLKSQLKDNGGRNKELTSELARQEDRNHELTLEVEHKQNRNHELASEVEREQNRNRDTASQLEGEQSRVAALAEELRVLHNTSPAQPTTRIKPTTMLPIQSVVAGSSGTSRRVMKRARSPPEELSPATGTARSGAKRSRASPKTPTVPHRTSRVAGL